MPEQPFTAWPLPGETEEERWQREVRVNAALARINQRTGLTRPDLGEPAIATGAPNPLGDPRKPGDRHGPR